MQQLCLELVPSLVHKNRAVDAIRNILCDVLPAGVPPFFRRVVNARYIANDRILAELEMVDGLAAKVEAWQWHPAGGWAHRWIQFDGGDLSWEYGQWHRVET